MPNPIEIIRYKVPQLYIYQVTDLSKALAILSGAAVRRYKVDREDRKP